VGDLFRAPTAGDKEASRALLERPRDLGFVRPGLFNPVDPLWQQFAKAYNQVAIHSLGGRGSPIQTQWLTPDDLTIPRQLARDRFTAK